MHRQRMWQDLDEEEWKDDPVRWRRMLRSVVFGTDTHAGRAFDVVLIVAILLSVLIVLLASVPQLQAEYGRSFYIAEWIVTVLFSIEYIARIIVTTNRLRYAFSFFGLIDLLSTIPTYLSLFIPGSESLIVIRMLRVLRIFRILKMGRYIREAQIIAEALRASIYKIIVFISAVLVLVTIMGTLMYLIEGTTEGSLFSSIPMSIYWAIVTLTTVGFGDIVPHTVAGQILASIIMLMGYAIIAVPTGLVTAEFIKKDRMSRITKECEACGHTTHMASDNFCSRCGNKL